MKTILITGATGKIGTHFINLLARSLNDWQIIIDTRNPKSAAVHFLKKISPHPIEAITLNEQTVKKLKALKQLTDLFVIAPFSPHIDKWHENLIQLLQQNKVKPSVVKVSVTGAKNPDEHAEVGQVPGQHWKGEQLLRDTGWATVSIRPNIFMQHFMMNTGLYVKGDNTFYLPYEKGKVSWLDCRDIAYCAYHLFEDEDKMSQYTSKSFELSGPVAIAPKEMQEMLSLFKKEAVKHVASMKLFEERCASLGISDRAKHFYQEAGEGWFSEVNTSDFKDITGTRPTNFAQFLYENQDWFKSGLTPVI